jgi:nucleoside-diphosphate-sugar epimerase
MRIVVTGGSGFLGAHLSEALLAAGHQIYILGRDFSHADRLVADGAIPIVADLRDADAVIAACKGMDVAYHVGALSTPWGRAKDFYDINVNGTAAIIEGCKHHHVRRLIYVSSPSVVFTGQDQYELTESAEYPTKFTSIYSQTKKLGEDLVNAAQRDLETVTLRPKAMFGPGDRALLPRLVAAARSGRLRQIGDGQNLVDLTYVENVVDALMLALDTQAPVGKTYHITNDEHINLWDTIRAALAKLGLQTTLQSTPLSMALGAARVMEWQAALTGREPLLTRYSVQILARTQTYDITAAKRDLGYAPRISFEEGMRRTLVAMGAGANAGVDAR